jgi:hypothetical protein
MKAALIACTIGSLFIGCSKDDNNGGGGGGGGGGSVLGEYTYDGATKDILGGEVLYTDPDVYLFFRLSDLGYLQIRFLRTETIPEGSFTYNGNSSVASYDPEKHFWGGNAFGNEITGGTVTVAKSGANHTVNFKLTAGGKPLEGNFSGTLEER